MTNEEKITKYIQDLISEKVGDKVGVHPNWCTDTLIASHKKQGKALKNFLNQQERFYRLSAWRRWVIKKISKGVL